jgi:hypothetical protein
MADLLVPVGRHLFTPAYLDELAARIPPDTGGAPHGVRGIAGLDSEGVHVAVLFSPKGAHLVARVAYEYDWTTGHKLAGDLLFGF